MKFQALLSLKSLATMPLVAALACAGSTKASVARDKIYVFESDASGFNTRSFFYDNGEEVVAFDTQFTPELARKSIDFLRTQTSNPIRYVVITHPNPDKFNGMSEFQKLGAKVVTSKATAASLPGVHEYKKYFFVQMARMFTEETYPKLARIDQVFERELTLKLGNGDQIRLRELSRPGVSGNQTIAYLPAAKAVMVGDLVHHRAHAWLEGGIVAGKPTPSISGWISDLLELQDRLHLPSETLVYGGRGETAPLKAAVPAQIRYLEVADRLVSDYVRELGSRKTELQGSKAGEHYQALQVQFEKQFPEYSLGYMIQYGVYGLLNSKL